MAKAYEADSGNYLKYGLEEYYGKILATSSLVQYAARTKPLPMWLSVVIANPRQQRLLPLCRHSGHYLRNTYHSCRKSKEQGSRLGELKVSREVNWVHWHIHQFRPNVEGDKSAESKSDCFHRHIDNAGFNWMSLTDWLNMIFHRPSNNPTRRALATMDLAAHFPIDVLEIDEANAIYPADLINFCKVTIFDSVQLPSIPERTTRRV